MVENVVYFKVTRSFVRFEANQIGESMDTFTFTLNEIYQYILNRGMEHPIVLVILMYLRFVSILQLLRLAESDASKTKFLSGFIFLSMFYSISHIINYVFLEADWFRSWYCASPAILKSLYRNAILFSKTINKKNTCTDSFMEWVIRDKRMYLGKFVFDEVDSFLHQVRQVAMQLDQNLGLRTVKIKNSKKNTSKRLDCTVHRHFQSPFCTPTEIPFCRPTVYSRRVCSFHSNKSIRRWFSLLATATATAASLPYLCDNHYSTQLVHMLLPR